VRGSGLRTRVAAAAAAAIVLAVALLGATVYTLLERDLRGSLDASLRERAAEVARLSASAPALVTRPGSLEAPLGAGRLSVQVVDRRGRTVARSLGLGGRLLPDAGLARAAIDRARLSYADARVGPEPLRLYVAPLADLGGEASGGAVVVAASSAEVQTTLDRLRRLLVLAALGAGVLGAGVAVLLTRRALAPVERLSTAAGEIERTGDATRRLPTPSAADEVGGLAATLNRMLAALERAREAERRFVGDASHELRTPLTALRGNAAYAVRHGGDPAVLADIEADAARLSELLDDLLSLAREDAAERPTEQVRLDELVLETAGEDPRVDVEAAAPVTVRGERAALERALANLIENARVHGPDGGRITVAMRAEEDRARLSVADEGAGLSPAEAEQAVARFWRGERARGRPGSGLGLAIVAAIAERHGGRVSIAGARVQIDLPLITDLSDTMRRTGVDVPPTPA